MTRFVTIDGPLGRHEILQRAGLAAVVVFALAQAACLGLARAGVTLPGAHGPWLLLAVQWAAPAAFALVHRALQPRRDEALPPPGVVSAALAGAGIGFVAWAFTAGLQTALATAGFAHGFLGIPEVAGLAAFFIASSRLRARARPRRPEWRLWRVPFAVVAAALYGGVILFAVGGGAQVFQDTVPYAWLGLPLGLWMAWVVFGRVIRGEPLGVRRKRRDPLAALLGAGLAAGAAAAVDLIDD